MELSRYDLFVLTAFSLALLLLFRPRRRVKHGYMPPKPTARPTGPPPVSPPGPSRVTTVQEGAQMHQTVNVGDKVRDRVTGLEGIAIARTVWLNGCVRVVIQPQEVKDGKPADGYNVDEPQVEILERQAVTPEPEQTPRPQAINAPARRTGGPRPDAARGQSTAR